MPVPASGPLQLRGDIALEVNGDATGTDVSLGALSNTAGFTEPDTMSEFYGFSMVSAPTVQTDSASSVSSSGMTLNGNATADGGASITSKGFYFGTDSNYANNTKRSSLGTGTGAFSEAVTGLSHSTTYYITAYAINSEGEGRGATVSQSSGAFTTPSVTTATTSNVYDTNMKLHGTMQSPDGGNLQYGWYFGTNPTMTSNTFIHDGNTNGSTSTINFDYTKGSLSGGTTYYIWTAVRQLDGTVLASASVKTQQTLAAIPISTNWGGAQNLSGSELAGNGNTSCNGTMSGSCGSSYNHPYHGWSGLSGGYSRSMTHSGASQWETYSSAPNVTRYWAWRTDGTTLENRSDMSGSLGGCLSGYGGQSESGHSWYSLPAGNSSTNRTLTGFTTSGVDWESWPSVNTQYCSGGRAKREVSGSGSGSWSAYAYNYL